MNARAKHRGQRIPGLFGFDDGTPTEQPEEVPDNPLSRACRTCGAQVTERCSRGGRGGRKNIQGFHEARLKPTPDTEETS